MSLNKTRKRSIAKSKRDLKRHKKKKIDNVIKQISKAIGDSLELTKKSFKAFSEVFHDKE
ncbi:MULTISPECIES: hypothetical protein [Streptococcus]|uniref:Uncharacterized protein n=1 Tax=Streptococcus parauberis KRS-02083 TaxID=1207545 RepID=A0ABP2SWV3_9STRE|nr:MULTISPECIES: hypothetical protein [Streptococcus]EMG24667.1 hypothetical protein SPJ1_1926 [Streptococcus parauberis KRS-02083]QBX27537.1 hypothetical protein Javan394_0026 [Streptococcus phage Javan394]WEM65262.1 hypothetical protein P1T45_00960 [Streptococcus parauberis]WOF47130.1 hypothetical protein K7G42_00955 [Streptococcus parauberis]